MSLHQFSVVIRQFDPSADVLRLLRLFNSMGQIWDALDGPIFNSAAVLTEQ